MGLVLSIPVLYQEESVDLQPSAISTAYNQLHIVHLVTMAHIVQILLSSQGKKKNLTYSYDWLIFRWFIIVHIIKSNQYIICVYIWPDLNAGAVGGGDAEEVRAAAALYSTVSQHIEGWGSQVITSWQCFCCKHFHTFDYSCFVFSSSSFLLGWGLAYLLPWL